MLGYSVEDMMGMRVENLCREEEADELRAQIEALE